MSGGQLPLAVEPERPTWFFDLNLGFIGGKARARLADAAISDDFEPIVAVPR